MNIKEELHHLGFRADAMHPGTVLRRDDGYSVSANRDGLWSLWHAQRVETRERFVHSAIVVLWDLEPELLTAYLHILPHGDRLMLPRFFNKHASHAN